MSLDLEARFSPRIIPASPEYPYGSLKPNTTTGSNDGTPVTAAVGNDTEGFKQAALTRANIDPSGSPDTAVNSQLLNALDKRYLEIDYQTWTFATGGLLTDCSQAVKHTDGNYYSWSGVFPEGGKVVTAGTNPTAVGSGYVPRTDVTLRGDLQNVDGASLVGWANYAQIRAYTGSATKIHCLGRSNVFDGSNGVFCVDASDTASLDNNGTILVDVTGRRWKRQWSGFIEPEWFGASGDFDGSSGFDNAPAFIAAFAYANSIGGGTVIGKSGARYRITHTIFVGDNTTFDGNGCEIYHDSNTTNGSAFMPMLYQSATLRNKNQTYRNFTLNSPLTAGNGIAGANATNVTVDGVDSYSLKWHLFDGAGCQDFSIINCRSYSTGMAPYQCDNANYANASEASDAAGNILPIYYDPDGATRASRNIVIHNCLANGTSYAGVHLHNTNNQNVTISDCVFENCANGIFSDSNSALMNIGLIVTGCSFIRCTIPVSIGGGYRNVSISNNYFFGENTDSYYYGINIQSSGVKVSIDISNNNFQGIIRPIIVNEALGVIVSNNSFSFCGGTTPPSSASQVENAAPSSIVALFGCIDGVVSGNLFVSCYRPVCISIEYGLVTTSQACSDVNVFGNVSHSSGAMLSAHGANRLTINGNKYVGLSGDFHGFYLSGCVEPTIGGNKINSGGGSGITISGCPLPYVHDSVIRSVASTGYAVRFIDSTVCRSSSNIVISGFTSPAILIDGTSTATLLAEPFASVGKAGTATGSKVTYTTSAI